MAGRVLERIKSPADLRDLSSEELVVLAREIRDEMIAVTAKNGGHLGPNLGVVELTIGLHLALNTPKDKIIWDVGHQSYVHKLLTGRQESFATLREHGGLSGFPKRSESPHDCFDTGHASNSISIGLGMAVARDRKGTDETIVAVIGDGSLTGGMAYEALNQAGHLKNDLIIILNDNAMSIDGNVGGLSSTLNRIRLDPAYNRLRDEMEGALKRIPAIGEKMVSIGETWKTALKQVLVPGMFFEELGIKYIGPIDGHDVEAINRAVLMAKAVHGPIVIHVKTVKGLGYGPAEDHPDRFHGTSPFDVKTGRAHEKPKVLPTYGQVFGESLTRLAIADQKIVAISAAMMQGTGLDIFAAVHPDRFFDVGIAEQHAVTFAAGLAQNGCRPVVAIYSTFLQRAYDQIVQDICLQGLPVVFVLDRAGLVGDDGPTHHGAFDLSYLSHMPEMMVCAPKDEKELQRLLATALKADQPFAIRYPRGCGPGTPIDHEFDPLPIGKGEVLARGEEVALVAVGRMVVQARSLAENLRDYGVNCTVVNARFVKPLDTELMIGLAEEHRFIFTLEDNTVIGGFGSHLSQLLAPLGSCRLVSFGLPDCFIGHGAVDKLFAEVGLDTLSLTEKILAILKTHDKREARQTLS